MPLIRMNTWGDHKCEIISLLAIPAGRQEIAVGSTLCEIICVMHGSAEPPDTMSRFS